MSNVLQFPRQRRQPLWHDQPKNQADLELRILAEMIQKKCQSLGISTTIEKAYDSCLQAASNTLLSSRTET